MDYQFEDPLEKPATRHADEVVPVALSAQKSAESHPNKRVGLAFAHEADEFEKFGHTGICGVACLQISYHFVALSIERGCVEWIGRGYHAKCKQKAT